jgi:heme/copper-type cytochrome/quinol oxidase subunit 2
MKKEDLEMICFIAYGLGTLLLASAVLIWASHNDWHWYLHPEEINNTITPLVVISMVFLVIGIVFLFLWRTKQEDAPTQTTLPKPTT